ncbi:MAG TPA: sulfite oxidase [Burkholderiales bacterium]|nr:sulfite oxidase [Burkholderiales bacterium]
MDRLFDIRRRHIILTGVAAAGVGTLSPAALAQQAAKPKPLPKYVEWKYIDSLIVHSSNTIETKRSAFGTSVVVPNDILFVRNNIAPPEEAIVADPDAWEVMIAGVKKPGKMTVAQLKRLGVETVAAVLQCSGNGRGYFGHKASGTQWKVGAAGCVIWSGAPVAAVVEAMGGVASGMGYMTATGGEKMPAGVDPKTVMVERSMPIQSVKTALLAWEINGEPIPLAHGGPLRLVVPGYYGINNVKYLGRLAFTDKETDAAIQRSGYRIRDIGKKGAPDQPSMWEMNVKSWVNHPAGEGPVSAGMVQIDGVAFAGVNAVKRVEVSVDGGKTWKDAKFIGPDLGRYAWRQFVLPVRLSAGNYTLVSRATDTAGNTQPEQRVENERGYAHNGWRDPGVKLTVA